MSGLNLVCSETVVRALYKALKAACDNSERIRKLGAARSPKVEKLYQNGLAALAKARGES